FVSTCSSSGSDTNSADHESGVVGGQWPLWALASPMASHQWPIIVTTATILQVDHCCTLFSNGDGRIRWLSESVLGRIGRWRLVIKVVRRARSLARRWCHFM